MLWQLILLVNLIRLKDAQIAGKTLFLGVSEGVSEEIIIWIHRLSEERLPSPNNVGTIQSFEGLSRAEKWRMDEFSLCLSWDIHLLPSDISASGSLTFGLRLGFMSLAPLVLKPLGLD